MTEPLGERVRRELARFGPEARIGEVVPVWAEAVGPEIARNAWPARVARDGTLHVATSSSAWAFELAHLERELLARLRAAAPDAAVERLKFAVGSLPEASHEGDARQPDPPPKPGPAELAKAASLAAPIRDEELRKLVAKAAAASLSRAVSNRSF